MNNYLHDEKANPEVMKEACNDSTVASGSGITDGLYNITIEYLIMDIVINFDEMSLDELEYLTGQRVRSISLSEAIKLWGTLESSICTQQ